MFWLIALLVFKGYGGQEGHHHHHHHQNEEAPAGYPSGGGGGKPTTPITFLELPIMHPAAEISDSALVSGSWEVVPIASQMQSDPGNLATVNAMALGEVAPTASQMQ